MHYSRGPIADAAIVHKKHREEGDLQLSCEMEKDDSGGMMRVIHFVVSKRQAYFVKLKDFTSDINPPLEI